MKNVTLYSASAGTGKTFTICQEIAERIAKGLNPRRIVAVTYTKKAAAELKSRVQATLLKKGLIDEAAALELAAIGTVHSVGHRLVSRFALRLGLSPDLQVLTEGGDVEALKSILRGLDPAQWERLAELAKRLPDGRESGDPLIVQLARLKRQIRHKAEKKNQKGKNRKQPRIGKRGSPDKYPILADLLPDALGECQSPIRTKHWTKISKSGHSFSSVEEIPSFIIHHSAFIICSASRQLPFAPQYPLCCQQRYHQHSLHWQIIFRCPLRIGPHQIQQRSD